MSARWLLIVAVLFIPTILTAQTQCPSRAEIAEWWKAGRTATPDEPIEVTGSLNGVVLTGKEEAIVVHVTFPKRGINSYDGVLLVRPKLKEAREVEMAKDFGVFGSYHLPDEPSVISATGWSSGGGHVSGEKRAIIFDGWDQVILHSRRFGDNLGDCGIYCACVVQQVEWIFSDLNGDEKVDLIEVVIQRFGGQKRTRWVTTMNTFLRKGNRYVASPPTMQIDPRLLKRALLVE